MRRLFTVIPFGINKHRYHFVAGHLNHAAILDACPKGPNHTEELHLSHFLKRLLIHFI